MSPHDAPHEPAGNRHRRLIRHHIDQRLIDAYFLARRNVPGHNLGLDDAFAQIRKFENYALHGDCGLSN